MATITTAPPAKNFNHDPMILEVETARKTLVGDAYEWTEPNLSGYLQVWGIRNDASEYFIVELNPNYNTADGKYAVNLARFLPLIMEPPPDSTVLSFTFDYGLLANASGKIKVLFGEQFGEPKMIEETLTESAHYEVVEGSTKYWNGFYGKYSQDLILLHSWKTFKRDVLFNQFYKEVLKDQLEYICIYCSSESESVTINVRVYPTTGGVVDYDLDPINIVRGVNYVRVDPFVLGVTAVANYGQYRLSLNADPQYGYLYYSVLDQEPEDAMYFLMDNGIGGLEVIRFQGKKTNRHETSFTEHERPVWVGDDFRKGQIQQEFKTGFPVIEANSGYYDREFIEHICQIMYGNVWFIDLVRGKFLRYRVISTSEKESDTHEDLYNLQVTFAQGWRDKSNNTFNQ